MGHCYVHFAFVFTLRVNKTLTMSLPTHRDLRAFFCDAGFVFASPSSSLLDSMRRFVGPPSSEDDDDAVFLLRPQRDER